MRFSRTLISFAVGIPLAIMLGYALATPDQMTFLMVGGVFTVLLLPVMIKWHHVALVLFWNSAFNAFFLPSQPHFWLIFAAISITLSAINFVMGRRTWLNVPQLTRPLLFLLAVVVITARIRGFGLNVLGGHNEGGHDYVYLVMGIVGYFALTAEPVADKIRSFLVDGFFLSQGTVALSNLVYVLGPGFYFLYYLLPVDFATSQAVGDYSLDPSAFSRYSGLGPFGCALTCFVLARWGLKGVLQYAKPMRLILLVIAIIASTMSGYRSALGFIGLLLIVQFVVEGLWKSRFLPVFLGGCVFGMIFLVIAGSSLPLVVQRSICFIPGIKFNPEVKQMAESSTQWREDLWREVYPEIPKYLLLGKGYGIDQTELYLINEATRMGLISGDEGFILTQGFHNGPLSLIIPMGIFGVIGFVWLLGGGIRVLYRNFRYGGTGLQRVNTLLFSLFIAQAIQFLIVFGDFGTQLFIFTGILGFSVSLNRGVARKPVTRRVMEAAPMGSELVPV